MKLRRIITPAVLIITMLVQFLPGTALSPRPAAAVACDAAQFVADVTIPDGTVFAAGAALVKTWRLKNIGTCTWSTSYAIVFYSGTKMGAPSVVNLPYSVAPGATVDVTVNMTAPSIPGHYRGYWMLRNASSVLFGVGPYGTWTFFIDIIVAGGSSSSAYDFVANYCSAVWSSGAGVLPCPGADGDARGFVQNLAAPKLEDGSTGPAGLLVSPQNITDGYIQGVYPAITIQSGDHFLSIINCQYGATGCYVTFQLNYQIGAGPIYTLKSFKEKIDGMYYNLDVDLSSLAGSNVTFILKVLATGSPAGDRAVWSGARIGRSGGVVLPPLSSTCDKGAFVADVTIPDGTIFAGGAAFTKTWRLQNVGSCTWTTSYKLVFVGGNLLGASATAFNLPTSVAPGGTIDLTVNMTAPFTLGTFYSYWKLQNASGVNFGVGSSGTATFFAKIKVTSSSMSASTTTITADTLDPSIPGASVAVSVTVSGATTPTGTVAITGADTNCTLTLFSGSGSCNVVFNTSGAKTLTATYSGDSTYASSSDTESHTVSTIVGPNADLSITINDGLSSYTPSGTVTYTVLVGNTGPSAVTGGTVTITKPAQITSWTVTCVADSGAVCTAGPTTPGGNITDSVDLPVGKKVTYTIVSTISGGAVGNMVTTATITNPGPTPDPSMGNNTATDTDAPPSAELAITKTDGTSTWTPGSSTTYTVVVTNNGPLNVSGATFNDVKPAQVTTWSWTCAPDSGATCGAGSGGAVATNITDTVSIPAGKKVTYTIVSSLGTAVPGNLINTATITSPVGNPDPVLGNNTATDTDTGPTADLWVTKTDGETFYTPGDTLTYTIRVFNNGPFAVTGATLSDVRPPKFSSWSWTGVPDISATCLVCSAGNVPVFVDMVNLPVGQGVTYTVVANVFPGVFGNLVNTVSLTAPGAIADPNPANNTATDTDVQSSADLSVTKTDGISVYPPGGSVTYTIVVTNPGPQDVVNGTIDDPLPVQISSWNWTCVPDSGAACSVGPTNFGVAFHDHYDIPAGKKVTYTAVAPVSGAFVGVDLVNTVTITPPGTVVDPVAGNNTATDTDVFPSADLAVSMTDGVANYTAGGTVQYTITVTNSGPSNVTGVTFSDAAPGLFDSWTWICAPQLTAVCSPLVVTAGAATFTDSVSIPAGKSITYTVVAHINAGAAVPISNTATINNPASPLFTELNPGNNSITDTDNP
jgi:uncharacterized repeat protein (TIGR01451 family)